MHRTLLVLPDGTEIFSGTQGTAVMECSLTQWVNDGKHLFPGAVCAKQAHITILEEQPVQIQEADPLTVYRVDGDGNRKKLGVFLSQKPERTGSILKLKAYDRLQLLDRDLSRFLTQLDGWPYSLLQLAELGCQYCGLTLQNQQIPNGSFPVEKFSAEGITGRMLMEWVAQVAGCFCVADENGQPRLDWYTPAPVPLGPRERYSVRHYYENGTLTLELDEQQSPLTNGLLQLRSQYLSASGDGIVTLTVQEMLLCGYCINGGLRLEQTTVPIEKVVLRQKETDVGVAWPENVGGCALCITGNPLLLSKSADALKTVAQTLFSRFGGVSYTPGTLQTPAGTYQAGQTVTVTDKQGKTHTFYIMQHTSTATGDTLVCNGSTQRQTIEAVDSRSPRSLSGKLLSLRTDVDGLAAEKTDSQERLEHLELELSGIRGQVDVCKEQENRLAALQQRTDQLRSQMETLQTQGLAGLKTANGYTLDDKGLHIFGSGQQMEHLLDDTGLYVRHGGQTLLQADPKGVSAADMTVQGYLTLGSHARLENYTAGRTACFWLEG